ncbi:hypothetical protein [Spongiibacter sp.]|uniref:hypothetical protein n=1 Tax=Spongiibacter sp. TaxID=2024860 RepID=UPI000C3C07B7|nr:hypothetical protein [Spongiibacter sp.]MBU70862.1 hypothetical protein [Spongiibacter sp.]
MEVKNYFAFTAENKPIPFCKAYLYEAGTSNLVTGLTDKNGNPIDNPFQADKDGLVQFAGPNGVYDLRFKSSLRDYRIRVSIVDTPALLAAATSAEASKAAAEIAMGETILSRDKAQLSALQAAAAGHVYESTVIAQSYGVGGAVINNAGDGATDGQYNIPVIGDGDGALYRAIFSGGALIAMLVQSKGGNYSSASFDFSAVPGFTGGDVTPVLLQNRPSGELYVVPLNDGTGAARYYINNNGVAYTEDEWIIQSDSLIKAVFANHSVSSTKIPLFKFLDGRVPLWLEGNMLSAKGLSGGLMDFVESWLLGKGLILDKGEVGYPDFSILTADKKVIFRYQGGVAYYYGKSPNVISPEKSIRGASLYAYKTAIAKAIEGAGNIIKLALTGDSWRERWLIPQRIADRLYAVYGQGADGWISVSSTDDAENLTSRKPLNGVTVARTNFTLVDISADAKTGLFGPDGHRIDCTTATGTITITGIRAETLKGYYLDTDGTWEYRIDGGSWVAVNEAGSGNTSEIEISGLSTASTHTLEIRTTGNTGTVTFYGFYATGISGIEVSKMANSGATAPQYASIVDDESVHYILQDIGVDLVEVCLGTNDFNQGVGLASYRSGLESLGSAYKSARTETGIVITSPPACNAAGSYPMSSYRDRAADAAKTLKCEHFDQFSLFASFDVMNNLGLWADGYHLNFIGGRFTTEELVSEYLIPF